MTGADLGAILLVGGLAGFVGALLGLGGGVFIVPLLTLGLGVPVQEAAATSLVCVLATSASGSLALDARRLVDLRVVTELEVTMILGAVAGGLLAPRLPAAAIATLFAAAALVSAGRLLRRALAFTPGTSDPQGPVATGARAPVGPLALGLSSLAGVMSGLLGIGGGPLQVPLMTEVMKLPPIVAFATSNVMIGITAAASTSVYLSLGLVRADLVPACALATAFGAFAGGRLAPRLRTRPLLVVFAVVLSYLALRMAWSSWRAA